MLQELNELELKRMFAIAILRKPLRQPHDSYDIATSIFGGDTVKGMFAGANWPVDPDVIRFKNELLAEHGAEYFLPTREELAAMILEVTNERFQSGGLKHDAKEREKLLRLYAEVRGFIKADKNSPALKPGLLPDVVYEIQDASAKA